MIRMLIIIISMVASSWITGDITDSYKLANLMIYYSL